MIIWHDSYFDEMILYLRTSSESRIICMMEIFIQDFIDYIQKMTIKSDRFYKVYWIENVFI